MSAITTHVLDTTEGRPAAGVPVRLELNVPERGWVTLGNAVTDADGRVRDLLPAGGRLDAGHYRLTFDTGAYFRAQGTTGFYPVVPIEFEIRDGGEHYHVPLLLSRFGYSTYRGS